MPAAGFHNDRDHPGGAVIVALHRPLHFGFVAVVRGQKVAGDQQQHNVCLFQVGFNLGSPLGPGFDVAVLPGIDFAFSLQQLEMVVDQLIFEPFVAPRVGDKYV